MNKFCFVFVLLLSLFTVSLSLEDSCPSGMRRLYLTNENSLAFGSARSSLLALNYYEGGGAMWFNKKILIEPRFEIHLKANLESVTNVEDKEEQELEGFTMVIAKRPLPVGAGTPDQIGYSGFTQSYIMEFDFNKNGNDGYPDNYAFKYCDSDCNSDDSLVISGEIDNQKFDPRKTMNWDFRLVYEDKKITVYSGSSEILVQSTQDLKEKFGNSAYIGFTGFMRGNKRELSLLGTFVCEDNFDITKTIGQFLVNGKEYDTYTYKAGEPITYQFSLVNSKGQVIPNIGKEGIWDYHFTISTDCTVDGKISGVTFKDEYNMIISLDGCANPGEHKFSISEASKGSGPQSNYKVIAGDVSNIDVIGHDGIIGTLKATLDEETGVITLKYGDIAGDFSVKDENVFVLDFQATDKYGNIADLGLDPKIASGLNLAIGSGVITVEKVKNNYQMKLIVDKPGQYVIASNYMNYQYQFNVVETGPNMDKSYCTLDGFNAAPELYQGEGVSYSCIFKDFTGTELSAAALKDAGYKFTCEYIKTVPERKVFTIEATEKEGRYTCEYKVVETGDYIVNAYLTEIETETTLTIPATVKSFKTLPAPKKLVGAKVLNPNTQEWMNIDSASFNYKPSGYGFFTALDLTGDDGKTLISSVGKYPDDFKLETIEAFLGSAHDSEFKQKLTPRIYPVDGKQYIGLFIDGAHTDSLVKKSTFDYQITVTFNDDKKVIPIKYVFAQPATIGNKVTCFHDMDPALTYSNFNTDENGEIVLKNGDKKVNIGTIELRTTDDYLYNYDIGTSKIDVRLADKDIGVAVFEVKPNTILGTYTVYATSVASFESKLDVYVNGEKRTAEPIKIKSVSVPACYLELKDNTLFDQKENTFKSTQINPKNIKFDFQLLDVNKELVKEANITSTGLEVTFGEKLTGSVKFSVNYNGETNTYTFEDETEATAGTFTWIISLETCGNYYFTYVKTTGPVDMNKSKYTIINPNILIGQTGIVEVTLLDANGNNIGLDNGRLDEAKELVTVKAGSNQLKYDSVTGGLTIRYKGTFDKPGDYKITANYDGKPLSAAKEDTLSVNYQKIDLTKSKMTALLDKAVEITPAGTVSIDNKNLKPVFKYSLYDIDGKEIKNYEKSSIGDLKLTNDKDTTITLVPSYQENYVTFNLQEKDIETFQNLKGGIYKLTFNVDGKEINYGVFLTKDMEGASLKEDYDLTKTVFGATSLTTQAGQTITVTMEMRADDNLRWNSYGDLNDITLSNSLGDQNLITEVKKGSKPGQFIISITPQKVTEEGKPNEITISYGKDKIEQKLSVTVLPGPLESIEYVSGSRDGKVTDLPTLKFSAKDKFGNTYTDLNEFSTALLKSLTKGTSKDGIALNSDAYVDEDGNLNVQYISKKPTTVTVTSKYFEKPISYEITNGPIDLVKTTADITTKGTKIGDDYTLTITPRDLYSNEIPDLTKDDLSKFNVVVENSGNPTVINCELKEKVIECTTPITKSGESQFKVKYGDESVKCNSCLVNVVEGGIDNSKTVITYNGKPITTTTNIEGTTIPTFDVAFKDEFGNPITDSSKIEFFDMSATLEGTGVKMCVSNKDDKKIISVCQPSGGDDNINKWNYLTNGDYKLVINQGDDSKTYTLSIKRKYGDGSSAELDLKNTVFETKELYLTACEPLNIMMELRATDNVRKNYWYPNPSESIVCTFSNPDDECKYIINYGSLPGQYNIKITCDKKSNNNKLTCEVENMKLTQVIPITVKPGQAYDLEVADPNAFTFEQGKYVFKTNPTNDDTVSWEFKLKDKCGNYLDNSVISEVGITAVSNIFGTDSSLYNIVYNPETGNYKFTENIKKPIEKHTWTLICPVSQNKNYFSYTKQPGAPNADKSEFVLDTNEFLTSGTSNALVYLKDKYGVPIVDKTLLDKYVKELSVTAKGTEDEPYTFDSITEDKALKYTKEFDKTGDYVVNVKRNDEKIDSLNPNIKITYEKYSPDKSQFKLITPEKELPITTAIQPYINNQEYVPSFKYYLYNEKGEPIQSYDKTIKATAVMDSGSQAYPLKEEINDGYIKFSFPSSLEKDISSLDEGKYNLKVNIDGDEKIYVLNLLGNKGSQDTSASSKIDLEKTVFDTTHLNCIAGETYDLNLEFRAFDGLRWNYEPNLNLFSFTNSQNLPSSDLKTSVKLGEKKGQVVISITPYKVTNGNDNILTISYNGKQIVIPVSLNVKNGPIKKLEYVSGLANTTVLETPTIVFKGYDAYGNQYKDAIGTSNTPSLKALTTCTNSKDEKMVSNVYADEENIYLQCKTLEDTKIKVTSPYFEDHLYYEIKPGPIDYTKSYGQITNVKLGDVNQQYELEIVPKDIYSNGPDVTVNDLKKFKVYYEVAGKPDSKTDITSKCSININYDGDDTFKCPTTITKAGDIYYHVEYDGHELDCPNCFFRVKEGPVDYTKTTIDYTNTETTLSKTERKTVQVNNIPEFEVKFHDAYGNEITDSSVTKDIKLEAGITGIDAYLCVKDNGAKKIITVCEETPGDNNINSWYYSPNGVDKSLVIKTERKNGDVIDKNIFEYPIELTGGSEEAAGNVDSCMTEFKPNILTLTAGRQSTIVMTLKDKDGNIKCKKYDDLEKLVSLTFSKYADCDYHTEESPTCGKFYIRLNCKIRTESNVITVKMSEATEHIEKVKKSCVGIILVEGEPETSNEFSTEEEAKKWGNQENCFLYGDIQKIPHEKEIVTEQTVVTEEGDAYYFDTNDQAIEYCNKIGLNPQVIKKIEHTNKWEDNTLTAGLNDITCNIHNFHTFNFITLNGNLDANQHIRGSVCVNGDLLGQSWAGIDDTRDNNAVTIQTQSYVKGTYDCKKNLWGRGLPPFGERVKKLNDKTEDIMNYWETIIKRLKDRNTVIQIKNNDQLADWIRQYPYDDKDYGGGDTKIRDDLNDVYVFLYEGTNDLHIVTNGLRFKGVIIAPYAKVHTSGGNWCGTIIAKSADSYDEAHAWSPGFFTKYVIYTSSMKTSSIPTTTIELSYTYVAQRKCQTEQQIESETEEEIRRMETCMDMKTIPVRITGNEPKTSIIYNMHDIKITGDKLCSGSVDQPCQFKIERFDEYGNLVPMTEYDLLRKNYVITNNCKNGGETKLDFTGQTDGKILVTFTSTAACQYIIENPIFDKPYEIEFTNGKPDPENTLVEVVTPEVKVGEKAKIIIIPKDQYNNPIDLTPYEDEKIENPFEIRYKEGDDIITINDCKIEEIKERDEKVFSCYQEFTKTGEDIIIEGYVDNKPLTCTNCYIETYTTDIDFDKTEIQVGDGNTFVEFKDGMIQKNTIEEPIYRIHFKDEYSNPIENLSDDMISKYEIYLQNPKNEIVYTYTPTISTDKTYVEFIKNPENDKNYEDLEGGDYNLILTDKTDKQIHPIILTGDEDGSSTAIPNPQNTHINSENLNFVAGGTGEIFVELRTNDNLRSSVEPTGLKVESCDKSDKTFESKYEKSGTTGVYYITVTTKKVTPKGELCELKIFVNGEEVTGEHPVMTVTPDVLYSSEIIDKYWKTPDTNEVLKDGNVDTEYVFEVKSYDKYDNPVETNQEIVGITVSTQGVPADTISSTTTDGTTKYIVKTTTASTYTVTSKINPETGNTYLPNDSIFNVIPGKVNPESTVVREVSGQIEAGNKPGVTIWTFDSYENPIDGEDFKNEYKVIFIDEDGNKYETTPTVDPNDETHVTYTTKEDVTKAGEITPVITFSTSGTPIYFDDTITVIPGEPDLEKAIITIDQPDGTPKEYHNRDNVTVNTQDVFDVDVILYDEYNNRIDVIPNDVEIVNPKLEGNNMEPIIFNITNNRDHFTLDFSDNPEYVNEYYDLVSGRNYEMTFEIKNTDGSETYNYPVIIVTNKDDSKYGNGPIDFTQSRVTPNDVIIQAGDYTKGIIEFRTQDGKLYNKEINETNIKVVPKNDDDTFTYDVRKGSNDNGIYTLTYYTTKSGINYYEVIYTGTNEAVNEHIDTIRAEVIPGSKIDHATIEKRPPETIEPNVPVEIEFKVYDQFDNVIKNRPELIDYMTFKNNGEDITEKSIIKLSEDGESFIITTVPKYPPNDVSITLFYDDGDVAKELFEEPVTTFIKTEPDHTKTDVESKNALKIYVGETLDMHLFLYDKAGVGIPHPPDYSDNYIISVTGPLESETIPPEKIYHVKTEENPNLAIQNEYEIITTSDDVYTKAGHYTVKVLTTDGEPIKIYNQICIAGNYTKDGFKAECGGPDGCPDKIVVTTPLNFTINGTDEYGNPIEEPLKDKLTFVPECNDEEVLADIEKSEEIQGQVKVTANFYNTGDCRVRVFYDGDEIENLDGVKDGEIKTTIEPGPCSGEEKVEFNTTGLQGIVINDEAKLGIKCYDKYGNPIYKGGEPFVSEGWIIDDDTRTPVIPDPTVTDFDNGIYEIGVIPPIAGDYVIRVRLDGEKFGDDVTFPVTDNPCTGSTPFLCPNAKKCVSDRIECLDLKTCTNASEPFSCLVDGVQKCVKSQKDCDCPDGFKRCGWQNYCVPLEKPWMCPQALATEKSCGKIDTKSKPSVDGICRYDGLDYVPSQLVCPMGNVLCADLSCRPTYYDCMTVDEKCSGVRCIDQTCATTNDLCPSTVRCTNPTDVVCPDKSCVSSEVDCPALNKCAKEHPYLCANLFCVSDAKNCAHTPACAHLKDLCTDNFCRDKC